MKKNKIIAYTFFGLALCYIIGIVYLFTFLNPLVDGDLAREERLAFYFDHKLSLQLWYLLIYVGFGILLIPAVSAMNHIFSKSILNRFNEVVGYIWAAFVIASGFVFTIGIEQISHVTMNDEAKLIMFTTIQIIQDALGGGVELLGGIWVFCIGVLAIKSKAFNKIFSIISIVLGLIGMLTLLPFFYDLGGVFGVLQIGWFVYLGFVFYKKSDKILS